MVAARRPAELPRHLQCVDGVVETDEWDPESLRQVLLGVAIRVCTRKQVTALHHYLDGKSTVDIARLMGIAQATAYRHLHGWNVGTQHHGGAITKLKAAIGADRDLMTELKTKKVPTNATPATVAAWFSGLRPSSAHLFLPFSVLLVAHTLADQKRSLLLSDLRLHVPGNVISAALGVLKSAGYIATDGVTITVRRTPLDDLKDIHV